MKRPGPFLPMRGARPCYTCAMRSLDEHHIQEDLHRLAGSLPHRGPNTESERRAAEYIRDRFNEETPNTSFEEFESIDSYLLLFAAYYSEFLVVAIVAIWFPFIAAGYGTAVFMAYLAEFTGYRLIARFFPRYRSQNVIARFLAERPRRLMVVCAHYDSGRASPLTRLAVSTRFRWMHAAVAAAMALAIASCLAKGGRLFAGYGPVADTALWISVAALGVAALFLLRAEMSAEYVRGAHDNAAGVAVLLDLARWLRENPFDEADVWLVATGSKEGWMSGMLHHLEGHDFDRETTVFVNVEYLGDSNLRYVTGEGMLRLFTCDPELIAAAADVAPAYDATPFRHRNLPTDLLIPLTRGYRGLGVTSTDSRGVQSFRLLETDTLASVDPQRLVHASRFLRAVLLAADARLRTAKLARSAST